MSVVLAQDRVSRERGTPRQCGLFSPIFRLIVANLRLIVIFQNGLLP